MLGSTDAALCLPRPCLTRVRYGKKCVRVRCTKIASEKNRTYLDMARMRPGCVDGKLVIFLDYMPRVGIRAYPNLNLKSSTSSPPPLPPDFHQSLVTPLASHHCLRLNLYCLSHRQTSSLPPARCRLW